MKICMMIIFLALNAASACAAEDPFLGTWTMNRTASRYAAGELPRKMVIVMRDTPEGIDYRSTSTLRDGRTVTAEYVADYDGHLAMVVGNAGLMAPVSVRKIDSHTVEASYIRGFKTTAVSRRVVSKTGLVLTITTTSSGEPGLERRTVGVYEKTSSQTPTTGQSYEQSGEH